MSLSSAERIILQRRLARLSRRGSPIPRFLGIGAALLFLVPLSLVGLGLASTAVVYAALAGELEKGIEIIGNVEDRELFETTRVMDREGLLLRELAPEGRRTYVTLDEVPEQLIQATVSVEDADFYANPGIDALGIGRAVYGELSGQPGLGGGSTITQQLVRWVAFDYDERIARSYERKVKEIVLALIMTRQYDKDQILEWYLNEIYYGNLSYGIEAAAQTIFGKSAKQVDLAEAALLAGLPQAPAEFDPLDPDPDVQAAVKRRQRTVLDLMVKEGYISSTQADAAAKRALRYAERKDERFLAPHFEVWVEKLLEERVGAARLARGGLSVYTSLDLRLQAIAETEVRDQVDALRERHDLTNAALVALEPATGQVLAMVGSYDYWNDAIDGNVNVAMRERQPGSSIKPVTYLTAIEQGMSPSTVIWDVPMELYTPQGIYEPVNYDGEYHGPVRLRRALGNSYNIPALKVLGTIPPGESEDGSPRYGVELVIDKAHAMGVTGLKRDPWEYGLSLTLGGGEVTLLDMTTVYATLANLGQRVRPNPILRIVGSDGEVLYDLAEDEAALAAEPAADARAAFIVTDMLSDNEARQPSFGTSNPLNLGITAAAKTGTTNDYRDNWTIGYTPYLAVGVWAGNSDNTPMRNSSGVTGAAPIWNGFMRNVAVDAERRTIVADAREAFGLDTPTRWERPSGVVETQVCRIESLRQPSAGCPAYQRELFIEDAMPEADNWLMASAVVVPLPPEAVAPPPDAKPDSFAAQRPPFTLCSADAGPGGERAQPVAVVPLPLDQAGSAIGEEQRFAVEWSQAQGWPTFYPLPPCTPELAGAAIEPGSLPAFSTAGLDSTLGISGTLAYSGSLGFDFGGFVPQTATYRLGLAPGSILRERTVLTGTVRFNPDEVDFFKVELGVGAAPAEYFTLGEIHRGPVPEGGAIEVLDAPSLAPGAYMLRLALVKRDGNVMEPPYSIPIRIER
ncbi:MAG: transglycosylase domain-containing protein [Chloroflexi bacterium]|nr:transglycosylase domain-containing protein [Chloroflexota bacterium]